MADYIDRDELLNEIDRHAFDFGLDDLHMLEDVINEMPTVEQKHGHWEIEQENLGNPIHIFTCSVCGEMFCDEDEYMVNSMKYCMNCGAKMDEVTE